MSETTADTEFVWTRLGSKRADVLVAARAFRAAEMGTPLPVWEPWDDGLRVNKQLYSLLNRLRRAIDALERLEVGG